MNKSHTYLRNTLDLIPKNSTPIFFIHIPKCAGSSIGKLFYEQYNRARHYKLQSIENVVENPEVVTVIRDPIDRFISSYNYHLSTSYNGGLLKTFPNLKTMEPEEYFEKLKHTIALLPQVDILSSNVIDIKQVQILRFSHLGEDLKKYLLYLDNKYDTSFWSSQLDNLKHANKARDKVISTINDQFYARLYKYYSEDYKLIASLNT